MPGLFGIADGSGRTDVAAFTAQAAAALAHRPWYSSSSWAAPDMSVGLGHSGIGILNRQPQPATSADGTRVLFFVGEFYRTDVLRERLARDNVRVPPGASDADLASTAYDALGTECAPLLDGAFLIAVYERRTATLTLINDRHGLYPTYLAQSGNRLAFAPEVKAVLCAPFVPRTLNLTAVAEYLRFQHLLESNTFHEGIELLPPASVGRFEIPSGRWTVQRYWDWDDIPSRPEITLEEAVGEVAARLRAAVRVRSSGDLRPCVFLSGGLDSRTLLGFLTEDHPAPHTATFGVRDSRDVYYAGRIAKAVGAKHHWFDLPNGRWVLEQLDSHFALTEGFHSWVHMHGMTMLPALRGEVDYNLSGWDGGTIMGHPESAKPTLNRAPDHAALTALMFHAFTREYTWPGLTEAEERLIFNPAFAPQMIGRAFESFAGAFSKYRRYRHEYSAEYFYLRNHCARLTQLMVTFARSHIEVRCPFWDQALLDVVYSLKPEVRQGLLLYRHVITREMPRLARIPYDKAELLPEINPVVHGVHATAMRAGRLLRLTNRRQTLYADYEEYLRTDLRAWAEGLLNDPQARYREILDPAFVRSLMARHMAGTELWTIGKVASILTLEMVLRRQFS